MTRRTAVAQFSWGLFHSRLAFSEIGNHICSRRHELRAPLARIRSTVDLLTRVDDAAFRSRALADVAAETDRMARMVRQLLILARADSGATIEPRPVRLGDVLATVGRHAQRMANGVTLHPAPADALADVIVNGDADHLEQLILILLDNAFKYTPPPGEVRLDAERKPDGVRVSVIDTGLGVPEEDAERIFERFYRGRNAGAATGTGLGLAIASWIADQHGGRIELTRTPGGGSRFTLHLPAQPFSGGVGHAGRAVVGDTDERHQQSRL